MSISQRQVGHTTRMSTVRDFYNVKIIRSVSVCYFSEDQIVYLYLT